MNDEIPDDIAHVASTIADNWCIPECEEQMAQAIARAILAERKRCADVARRLNGWGSDCGRGGHAEHIADAIMRGANT